MKPCISVITLGVGDIERSRQFYIHGLGWTPYRSSNEHIVFVKTGGVLLALYGREALAEDATVDHAGSGFRGVAVAQNVRTKADVDAALSAAVRAGAKLVKPAQEVFWGGYSGYFADPDGHLWEVAYNPHWGIDESGQVQLPD